MRESPSTDDIIHAREQLEKGNISGVTSLIMASSKITSLSSETFDFQTFVWIKTLYLQQNIFYPMPLTYLEDLYLYDNQISFLSPIHFVNLKTCKFWL